MIRVLLGSALPVLGLGLAAATFGPDLLTGPRGEPMIMAAPDAASLQPASFDGDACPSALLFSSPSGAGEHAAEGPRVIAFALRSGSSDVAVAVEDFPGGADATAKTVVLVFDETGHLIAAGDPASMHLPEAAAAAGCIKTPDPDLRAPV